MIWHQGEEKLNEFIQYMNGAHMIIKFTAECSRIEVNYIETMVKFDNTYLYTKDTDTQYYLHYTLCHPTHCKKVVHTNYY